MVFNKKTFGEKICQARKETGMSREQVAEQIMVSKATIDKWEQGKHTPQIPEVVAVAQLFKKKIEFFLEEEDDFMPLTEDLKINPNAAKPVRYEGLNEILNGWRSYYKEYDYILCLEVNNAVDITECTWREENKFQVLINKNTRDICAIRDFGMYDTSPSSNLFKTEYLPLFTHQPVNNERELKETAEKTLERFKNEVQKMKESAEYPLFLLWHCGANNYVAWSLTENKEVYVYDYKKYRENFFISDIDIYSLEDIKINTKYEILPPSNELIQELGLSLSPSIWERKFAYDKWEYREEKENMVDIVPLEFKPLYIKALNVINKARKKDYGYDEEIARLENRVFRFERLCQLGGAPKEIIEKETYLIEKAYDAIRGIIEE